jgi:NADPH:quinone reductase-like Zn-dependent oxidoreductase
MRIVRYDSFGDPAELLHLGESPLPEPGKGQVRVRTILSPIHHHDLWTVRGTYGLKPPLPAIGGSEAVGVVDAVGDGVDAALVGKRVAAAGVYGAWAEYFVAAAAGVLPMPDAIGDEAAAQLVAMPFSAIALLEFLNVKAGDWIIQNTANGAVGRTLALLARSRGVHTINLVRRDAGVAELAAAGIDNAVSTEDAAWKDKVRAIAGGQPIRAAVDSIGGKSTDDLADVLGEDGLLVSFGAVTGSPIEISSGSVIFKQLTLKGFWGNRIIAAMPGEQRRRLMGELVTLVAKGDIPLKAQAVFGFDDVVAAVHATLAPGKTGKVMLRP